MDDLSKINKKKLVGIIILISIIILTPVSFIIYFELEKSVRDFVIEIGSDEDFEEYGFPGSGTEQDPYRIENYTIHTSNYYAIVIHDVTKYFRIWNNILHVEHIGIYIVNVAPNITQIMNNFISGGETGGIFIRNVDGGIIENNTCCDNFEGIFIERSMNWQMRNNNLKNNKFWGIDIRECQYMIIENNTFSCSEYVGGSLTLWYNIGLHLLSTPNSTIRFNNFKNNGLSISLSELEDYSSIIVENNTVNGLELGYFFNYNDRVINKPNYGQLILLNCSNINVTNQFIIYSGTGIKVSYCNNCCIYDNIFNYNRLEGIYLYDSNEISIYNNTYYKNMYGVKTINSKSIKIENSSYDGNYKACYSRDSLCSVYNCMFFNQEIGYHLNNFYTSLQVIINHSLFYGNHIGVELYNANSKINYCEFYYNTYGFYIYNSTYEMNFNSFANNTEDVHVVI